MFDSQTTAAGPTVQDAVADVVVQGGQSGRGTAGQPVVCLLLYIVAVATFTAALVTASFALNGSFCFSNGSYSH